MDGHKINFELFEHLWECNENISVSSLFEYRLFVALQFLSRIIGKVRYILLRDRIYVVPYFEMLECV